MPFFRAVLGILLLISAIAHADWRSSYPPSPLPTVTKQKLQELEKQIKQLVPVCVDELERKFDRPWKRQASGWPVRLQVSLMSALEAALVSDSAATRGHFFIRMNFDPYPFLSGNLDLKTAVCHESVHAYFRYQLSFFKYVRLPRWAREGSAVYLSGQLAQTEYRALYRAFVNGAPVINGLDEGKHNNDERFEDALAFQFFQQDSEAAISVLQQVLEGKNIYEAVTESTGLAKNDLLLQTRKYANQHLEARKSELSAAMLTAIKEWGAPGTRPKAEEYFLQKVREGLEIENNVTLDFAMSVSFALETSHNKESALLVLPLFKRIEQEVPGYLYGHNLAILRNQIAGLSLKVEQYSEALTYYARIFNEHAEAPILQKAAPAGILRSLVGLKDWAKVLPWTKNESDLDKSTIAEYHYYRALAYRALNKVKKAKKLFQEVCKSEDNAQFKEKACAELH
ncbi:MAG: hypothetical protein A2X86_02970 [Bdellovibrionales bacterium GWA2_49_15]|nr:MAG: hypothetical protein A2X86_02970 [Bdellovibrionales bacterium GWA2_49_15]HAZ14098.1 hypothetical protein [Bdellovibrionales bacterium]